MEPNKFEEHIKGRLGEREIKPSSDAWVKLNDELDRVATRQPKKRGYLWYAAVACFVGLIILSVVVLKPATSTISNSNIQVVKDDEKGIEESDGHEEKKIQENTPEVAVNPSFSKVEENDVVVADVAVQKKQKSEKQYVSTSSEVQTSPNNTPEDIITNKVLQIVAQVDALEQDAEQLTDVEVDSLLRKAQEEILTDKLFKNDRSVDAMALLSEVEYELDKSFRDQIFESLKSGFLKVRTAVADRNN